MSEAADHCHDLVRNGAKDRYLASLFAPGDKRPQLLALYAFDLEISRIHTLVSDPQIGLIRQQWWLDSIDAIYAGSPVAHPVAEELARAVAAGNLPKPALRNLIIAREFDLYDDPMPELADLEGYLGETSSSVIQLASLILAGPNAVHSAEAAGLAGVAHGLAGLLRAIVQGHPAARHFLPRDLVTAQGEKGAIAALAGQARTRLAQARALTATIPPAALPVFLPVSLTGLYLDRLKRGGVGAPSQIRRQMALWWAARNDRF